MASGLLLWHECFLAWPLHPSLSHVGFVGVLEQLGKRLSGNSKKKSEGCAVLAIERWGEPSEIEALMFENRFYRQRSRTAHGERTYGIEDHLSRLISVDRASEMAHFDGDDADFHVRHVGLLAQICARGLHGMIVSENHTRCVTYEAGIGGVPGVWQGQT